MVITPYLEAQKRAAEAALPYPQALVSAYVQAFFV
jgi:hypothetical protein